MGNYRLWFCLALVQIINKQVEKGKDIYRFGQDPFKVAEKRFLWFWKKSCLSFYMVMLFIGTLLSLHLFIAPLGNEQLLNIAFSLLGYLLMPILEGVVFLILFALLMIGLHKRRNSRKLHLYAKLPQDSALLNATQCR